MFFLGYPFKENAVDQYLDADATSTQEYFFLDLIQLICFEPLYLWVCCRLRTCLHDGLLIYKLMYDMPSVAAYLQRIGRTQLPYIYCHAWLSLGPVNMFPLKHVLNLLMFMHPYSQ